jgi:hypothetical protein
MLNNVVRARDHEDLNNPLLVPYLIPMELSDVGLVEVASTYHRIP